jgi:hypothetical protein
MPQSRAATLRLLDALRLEHGPDAAGRKRAALAAIAGRRLATARQLRTLHEFLSFTRAYPDSPEVLADVERQLASFAARADLRRLRGRLVNSGIAGTDIVYPFGRLTAKWLADRWGDRLVIEWDRVEDEDPLARLLILAALDAEVPGLDEAPLGARAWMRHLSGGRATDTRHLASRADALEVPERVRDRLYESLHLVCRLRGGPDTPSRTGAHHDVGAVHFQSAPLRRDRPDLRREAMRPPLSISDVPVRTAARLIDLAREAMVTRERDLDAFVWADARDVRLVDCGEGLQFACIGAKPERRFLLESVYGLLTLRNGVPIGYALASGLLRFSEIAFNVFETFRGAEAAHVLGRLLATSRALFAAERFTVPPYQLGDGNDEGLTSGAWWFYYKLGFRPRARAARALVAAELRQLARRPSYRTPVSTLERIVPYPVYLSLGRVHASDGIEALRLDRIGLAVTRHVAARFGADRERAGRVLADEAGELLGMRQWRRLPDGERDAWRRWGPLVAVLPGVAQWGAADRRALADVIRAKGGRRESDFVRLLDAHAPLRAAILSLSRGRLGPSRG